MPDIGVAHGKRSDYARILPALPERADQRLQPEVEPRAGNEPGRGRRAAGAALSRGTVASTVRQSRERRSEEHTSELQSQSNLVCRLLLEKKKKNTIQAIQQ